MSITISLSLNRITTVVSNRAGTPNPFGLRESTYISCEVHVVISYVICVVFCRCLITFCPFSFVHCIFCRLIVYGADYPICILRHFLFDESEDKDTKNKKHKRKTNEEGKLEKNMNSKLKVNLT